MYEDCVTQKCTSFLIQGTDTYNKLTIYLLLIFISELLECYIVKICCVECCMYYMMLYLRFFNKLLFIDR